MENAYSVTGGGPVLTLFAHPDDTEFVCGGALALWAQAGRQLIYAFCTDGSKGSADPTMTAERLVAQRQEEQRAAARHLGCNDVVFLPYPDAMLEPTLDLRRDFTRIIRQYKPEIVVCFDPEVHYFGDSYIQHPDHRASGEAALAAVFPSARDRLTFPELLAEGLGPHNMAESSSPAAINRTAGSTSAASLTGRSKRCGCTRARSVTASDSRRCSASAPKMRARPRVSPMLRPITASICARNAASSGRPGALIAPLPRPPPLRWREGAGLEHDSYRSLLIDL